MTPGIELAVWLAVVACLAILVWVAWQFGLSHRSSGADARVAVTAGDESLLILEAHLAVVGGDRVRVHAYRRLRGLIEEPAVSETTRGEVRRILALDQAVAPVSAVAAGTPVDERPAAFERLIDTALVDGHLDSDEIAFLTEIAQAWTLDARVVDERRARVLTIRQTRPPARSSWLEAVVRVLGWVKRVEATDVPTRGAVVGLMDAYRSVIDECARIAARDFADTQGLFARADEVLALLAPALEREDANLAALAKEASSDAPPTPSLAAQLDEDRTHLRAALSARARSIDRITLAVLGRTNVGKSTLLAILAGGGRDEIGRGVPRTTRTLRSYEWERLRVLDTPGFGAVKAADDERIAKRALPETDVACLVVTNDGQIAPDFDAFSALRGTAKPLLVVLNFKSGLDDERDVAKAVRKGVLIPDEDVRGHERHIRERATAIHATGAFMVIPVHLEAALLAIENRHPAHTRELWRLSGVPQLIDGLRLTLLDEGPLRRSQTLLGAIPGELRPVRNRLASLALRYARDIKHLEDQRKAGKDRLEAIAGDADRDMRAGLRALAMELRAEVPGFAEANYQITDQEKLDAAWRRVETRLNQNARIRQLLEDIEAAYRRKASDVMRDTTTELRLFKALTDPEVHVPAQRSNALLRKILNGASVVLTLVGAFVGLVFALPVASLVLAIAKLFRFRASKEQSDAALRARKVQAIHQTIMEQIDTYQRDSEERLSKQLRAHHDEIAQEFREDFRPALTEMRYVRKGLDEAIAGIDAVAHDADEAFATRVIDWARERPAASGGHDRRPTIRKVERDFGVSMTITLDEAATLRVPPEQISQTLQEHVIINSSSSTGNRI
jgi:hypothetical protein